MRRTETIGFRTTQDVRAVIRAKAEAESITMSDVINRALRRQFARALKTAVHTPPERARASA